MTRLLRLLAAVFAITTVVGAGVPGSAAAAQVSADDIEVILAIDTSGSMDGAIGAAKAAATTFVGSMPPDVRIGLLTFADTVTLVSPPTTDRESLKWQIGSLTTGGDTALYDVVVEASRSFSPAAVDRVLVVLSDGRDEGSSATLTDAVAAAQSLDVEAISLTTAQTDLASLAALGQVTPAEDAAAVAAAFARVASLIVETIEPVPSTTSTTTPPTTAPPTTAAVAVAEAAPPPPSEASVATTEPVPSTAWLWVGAVGVFVGLFLLGALLFPRARVSRARLGIQGPRTASEMGQRTVSAIDDALERYGKRTDLGTSLAMAQISMRPGEFVAMVAVIAVVAGSVALWLGGPLVAIATAGLVCLAVRAHVVRATNRRRAAFVDQLPEVLQLVTAALRSGYGITQALESVAEEAEEPARSEFANVLAETRLGRDLSDSLHALAARMDSKDLEWVVSAIDINRDAGGNLSEVLQKVSATIRERGRLARQVRTLTAEGRLSARILTGLPFVMLLWQWRVNPENFAELTQGIGLVALVVAGVLLVVGSWWVRRIVNSVAL